MSTNVIKKLAFTCLEEISLDELQNLPMLSTIFYDLNPELKFRRGQK